ncbi:MAG: uracil-DNA glycosylase [Chloroflexi bacterium]|nr:uracil-DNA glycosylase [Chloroflexota bacterium]
MSTLTELAQRIGVCTNCPLSRTRTQAVPGEGPERPALLFIGEGPGYYEDQQGRPFVGPAGKLLEELLEAIGLHRSDVYITNVVKCRPPANRDPLPSEISACRSYLDRQIELLDPRVIVTLGRFSLAHFFPQESISKVHGKSRPWNNRVVFPMYHPAAALRSPQVRIVIAEDAKRIPELLEQTHRETPAKVVPQVQQLNLF